MGGTVKPRQLGRSSPHRQALLRNLVTSLIERESIYTTWHKAKEAQRVAERLITLAKRGNENSRRKAQGILFTPHRHLPKLFTTIRNRYLDRPGGYTRILRTEPKNPYDQGASAILELVDGPRDMRFHLTAAAIARDRALCQPHSDLTLLNRKKVTQLRENGDKEFEKLVEQFERFGVGGWGKQDTDAPEPEVEGGWEGDEDQGDEVGHEEVKAKEEDDDMEVKVPSTRLDKGWPAMFTQGKVARRKKAIKKAREVARRDRTFLEEPPIDIRGDAGARTSSF